MNLLNKLKKIGFKEEIPAPERFPNGEKNITNWMEEQVLYYLVKYPDNIANLFNPSSGDYLPLKITAGISEDAFKRNIEAYRKIKERFPEAIEKAKKEYLEYSYSRVGAPEDYPQS